MLETVTIMKEGLLFFILYLKFVSDLKGTVSRSDKVIYGCLGLCRLTYCDKAD